MPDFAASESLSFDPVAHLYDDTRGYPPQVSAQIADGLMRYGPIASGARLLEIGIGTGRIALPLLERGVHVSGVDISERMLQRLHEKYDAARAAQPTTPWGRLDVALGDMTALPFADDSFDVAVAVHVLHLVPQWRRALDEVMRALRPGAPLLLGQDVTHGSAVGHPMQDEWVEIVRELGYRPERPGAGSFAEILAEVEARGWRLEETTLASWTSAYRPEAAYRDIASRSWSLTWRVPDAIFAESTRRLERWARERYGADWQTPSETNFSFKLARVTAS